ncbi:MAG: ribonuclease P protein component [Candidatus Omnitrophica bacterium]|nr:ribonuclease P protein component [Candidatus Omnitrophota bacterium]
MEKLTQVLKRIERLGSPNRFKEVRRLGLRARAGRVSISILENGLPHNRAGFSVRSKGSMLAVRRNRIKRLLKEGYRRHKDLIKPGADIVIAYFDETKKLPTFSETEKIVAVGLKKAATGWQKK